MKLSRTTLILVSTGVVMLLVVLFLMRPTPLPVESGKVSRGQLQVTLDGEGMTRVRDKFTIAAPVTGELGRIELREGDPVGNGQVVARLFPPELDSRVYQETTARVNSSRAATEQAGARQREVAVSLDQARLKKQRYARLFAEGAISKESFEQAQNEASTLQKQYQEAGSALKASRYDLAAVQTQVDRAVARKPVDVVSPIAGHVLKIYEKSRRLVAAGSPLVDLGELEMIEIVIDVLSSDAVKVKPQNRVLIGDWGGEATIQAEVQRVEPAAFTKISALGIEEKRVNIVAVMKEKVPSLGDNFRVQARIVLWEGKEVLQVPLSSLFRSSGSWNVFVIDAGRARVRAVKTGQRSADQAEVTGGLREGERVVLHPANELQDGMRVKDR